MMFEILRILWIAWRVRMEISKTDCGRLVQAYLDERVSVKVAEGWPEACYRSASIDPVWTARVSAEARISASRIIVVSQDTGDVMFDGFVGE